MLAEGALIGAESLPDVEHASRRAAAAIPSGQLLCGATWTEMALVVRREWVRLWVRVHSTHAQMIHTSRAW